MGKYDVGAPRPDDYDYLRAYHGRHWVTGAAGERVHVTEQNARDSLEFLKTRPKDKPFALSVGVLAPHAEDSAKEQYCHRNGVRNSTLARPFPFSAVGPEAYLRALPPFLSKDSNEGRIRFNWRFDTPARYQGKMIRYYRLITEVDAAVGRLVDELKAEMCENTLIVFMGDNGYFHGDRGLADKWYPIMSSARCRSSSMIRVCRQNGAERREGVCAEHRHRADGDIRGRCQSAGRHPGLDLSPLYVGDKRAAWRDEFFYEHPTITSRDRIPSSRAVVRRD